MRQLPTTCPVCHYTLNMNSVSARVLMANGTAGYECERCGPFMLAEEVRLEREAEPQWRLSAWIRERYENRLAPSMITPATLDMVNSLPPNSLLQKQRLLLRAIERRTGYGGQIVQLSAERDYPVAWARNVAKFEYLLDGLVERGLIDCQRQTATLMRDVSIQLNGWDLLETLADQPIFSDRAFIAMSFDSKLEDVWAAGIKPAVERAGFKPLRVDKDQHIDRIDAKIINEISDSHFVVADVTQQRQGVYFEAGFALGLGRPVIWSVRQDDLEKVHFDTRQYRHIVWSSPADLQEQLYELIRAVIGARVSMSRGRVS